MGEESRSRPGKKRNNVVYKLDESCTTLKLCDRVAREAMEEHYVGNLKREDAELTEVDHKARRCEGPYPLD